LGATLPEGLPGRAFVAETPIDDPGDDRRNVAMLWELAGLKEQSPDAEKGFSMLTPALKKKLLIRGKTGKRKKLNAEAQSSRRRKEKKTARKKSGARQKSAKKKRG
jgi:hypothetical protein